MRTRQAAVGAVLLLAVRLASGCGGDGAGATQATPVTYPASFPVQGAGPSGAKFSPSEL